MPIPAPATAQIGTASQMLTAGEAITISRATPTATMEKPARSTGTLGRGRRPCHHEPIDQPSAASVRGIPTTRGVAWWTLVSVSGR